MHDSLRIRACLWQAAVVALLAMAVHAQDATTRPPSQNVPLPPGGGDVIYLRDAEGRPVPVLLSPTLQEILKALDARKSAPVDRPPEFGVSSLAIEGHADDVRATLKVRLGIQTHQKGWVTIPLGLTEGYLVGQPKYEGPGEHSPGDFDAKTGYTWRIRGEGMQEHALTFSVDVPLRQVPLSRRLLLTLPKVPANSLKLSLPPTVAVTPAMERATVQVRPKAAGTEVEAYGLGERLDVSWQPQPAEAVPATVSLETTTALLARIVDGHTLDLDATLNVKTLRGALNELRIVLPPGFSSADKTGSRLLINGEEPTDVRNDPDDPQVLIVTLKSTAQGPVEVTWRGTQRLSGSGTILVAGPLVDRTDLHSGFLALIVVGDFVARPTLEADPSVERVSPSSLPPRLRETGVTKAYRVLRQPFQLPLTLQKIEPFATVEPQAWLHAAGGSLDLDVSWRFQVFRGSLTSIRIDWPDRESGRWVMEPIDPPALIESVEQDQKGMLLRLIEPTKGSFVVKLKARRPVTSDAPVPVGLPEVTGLRPVASEMVLTSVDNLESSVSTLSGQLLVASQFSPRRAAPPEAQKFSQRLYRFEPGEAAFQLALLPHEREVTGRSVARLSASRGRLNVAQQLVFNVQYERLSQLRFTFPLGIPADQVRFFHRNAELVPTVTRDGDQQRLTVSLDQPRMGQIELEARYRLDDPLAQPGTESARVALPFLVASDVNLEETRFEWTGAAYDLDVISPGWARQPASEGTLAWTAPGTQSRVETRLVPSANPSLRGAVVTRCLIRSRVDGQGRSIHVAQYRLSGQFANLRWVLPADATLNGVWWNSGSVTPARRRVGRDLICDLAGLDVPTRLGGDDHLLTISWQTEDRAFEKLVDSRRLAAPVLLDVLLAETIWDIEIPGSHFLLQDPEGFEPRHTWTFENGAWWRVPNRASADLAEWIDEGDGPQLATFDGGGNHYQFGRLGAVSPLSVVSMTGSGIVLLGAGVCAALGLVLLQSSRTRNVLTLMLGAVVFAGLGVASPGTALVLLQPAAVGVFLAIVFSVLQHLVRRRRPDPMSMTSGSSYPVPPGSSVREPALLIGSEENTLVRPPSKDRLPVPSESGSRG